jgi:hypothetical protein
MTSHKSMGTDFFEMAMAVLDPSLARRSVDERAADVLKRPARSTLSVVSTATLLFFAAERGHNPQVKSVWDALAYVTTCLSVGYHNVFPVTSAGKIIGSALMTIGPSLSGAALDGPHGDKPDDQVEREILATLKQILARLPAPSDTDQIRVS